MARNRWESVLLVALLGACAPLSPIVKKWMHLDTLRDDRDLAGRDELAENQGPGMFPQSETKPEQA